MEMILLLLLLDIAFELRKIYHELRFLVRIARVQWRARQFRKLAITAGLAVIAFGPLVVIGELLDH
jgi:hypothetical protein